MEKWITWIPFTQSQTEVEIMTHEVLSFLITQYLGITAQSERELSEHLFCLPSFSSERWTWINVYLSPFLSSWEFALHPKQKAPHLSPQCFIAFLCSSFSCWATGRHWQSDCRNHKKERNTRSNSAVERADWCAVPVQECVLWTL